MSAHRLPQRRGLFSALAAHVTDFVFEPTEQEVDAAPQALEPRPVVAVVAAAPKCGATTAARLLAAELAARADGAAVVTSTMPARRTAPPSRAAIRLATALGGVADAQPCGRLCIVPLAREPADRATAGGSAGRAARAEHSAAGGSAGGASAPGASAGSAARAEHSAAGGVCAPGASAVVNAARYLAPVVLDLPADGSAADVAAVAERVIVVAGAAGEPALLDAVAGVVGGDPIKVVNRVTDPADSSRRATMWLPDSRIAARAAAMGTRPLGPLGTAISALADMLEAPR